MNQDDRARLQRLQEALCRIPFPHDGSGTKTASLAGLVDYVRDMRKATPMVRAILSGMIMQSLDREDNDIEEGWDYVDPDETLDLLEAWCKKRVTEKWQIN